MKERLQKLLCVKSIVTLILTLTFSALALFGTISGEQFVTIFTTVISFYFGTQHEQLREKREGVQSQQSQQSQQSELSG